MFRLQPEREPQPDRGVLRDGAAAPDGARGAERLRGHQPKEETGKKKHSSDSLICCLTRTIQTSVCMEDTYLYYYDFFI